MALTAGHDQHPVRAAKMATRNQHCNWMKKKHRSALMYGYGSQKLSELMPKYQNNHSGAPAIPRGWEAPQVERVGCFGQESGKWTSSHRQQKPGRHSRTSQSAMHDSQI
jgi:hypothetical protein